MKTDTELQSSVMAELKFVPSVINAANIGVAAKNGIVTLSGFVDSYTEKWTAEQAVKRVAGVSAVAVEIEVRLPGSSQRTDAEIAQSAVTALRAHTWIPYSKIKLSVQGGVMTLEGEVEWWYQKEASENAVRNLIGVKGVINEITVKPTAKPTEVKSVIEGALQRNAILEAKRISVETRGDRVILSGRVKSWAEKQAAEEAACSAPGVASVENNILVA